MQAIIVTCNDEKGQTNPITIAWHSPISKNPPLYGISVAPSRYSHNLIEKSKEFVINFIPFSLVEKVHFCGSYSGRKIDKINQSGLTLDDSEKVKTKYIKECFAHFECKLHNMIVLGDHTLFVGEIVNILADEDAFIDDKLSKKMTPCYYIGDCVYTTIKNIRKKI
jgi:flavin reductase (DIM6/NTAB) family NADH-FMN oxidoreductase RutF